MKYVIGNLDYDEFLCIIDAGAHMTDVRENITLFDSKLYALQTIQMYTKLGYHTDHLSIINSTEVIQKEK